MSSVHTVEMRPGRPQPSDNRELSTHGLCDQDYFLDGVRCNDDLEPWYVSLNVNDNLIKFKVDLGADKTIITEHVYHHRRMRPGAGGAAAPPAFGQLSFLGSGGPFLGQQQWWEGGCFSIFRRANDVTQTMSKGGCL